MPDGRKHEVGSPPHLHPARDLCGRIPPCIIEYSACIHVCPIRRGMTWPLGEGPTAGLALQGRCPLLGESPNGQGRASSDAKPRGHIATPRPRGCSRMERGRSHGSQDVHETHTSSPAPQALERAPPLPRGRARGRASMRSGRGRTRRSTDLTCAKQVTLSSCAMHENMAVTGQMPARPAACLLPALPLAHGSW